MNRLVWLVLLAVASFFWLTAATVSGLTPQGVITWIVAVLLPIAIGQLRNYGFRGVADGTAKLLSFAASLLAAGLVLYFTGNLHAPSDMPDLASEVAIVFTLSQLAYAGFYKLFSDKAVAALVG